MRILFISNYFPGDLGPLARVLAASPGNDVLCASIRQRKGFALPGVRRVRLKNCHALFDGEESTIPRIWEAAVQRGGGGLRSMQALRDSWGAPDIIFASMAAGAGLFAPQAFPGSFIVAYAESGLKNYSLLPEALRNAWALMQGVLFLQGNLCYAFSEEERQLFAPQLQGGIRIVPPCVDTDLFSRAAAGPWPGVAGPLLTLNAIGIGDGALAALLETAHAALRALPLCRVVMLTENRGRSESLARAAGAWEAGCRSRFAVYDALPFLRYRDLLAASSVVVCPAGGEAARRSMLQCMSCETLLMARPGAADFLRPGVNMLAARPWARGRRACGPAGPPGRRGPHGPGPHGAPQCAGAFQRGDRGAPASGRGHAGLGGLGKAQQHAMKRSTICLHGCLGHPALQGRTRDPVQVAESWHGRE